MAPRPNGPKSPPFLNDEQSEMREAISAKFSRVTVGKSAVISFIASAFVLEMVAFVRLETGFRDLPGRFGRQGGRRTTARRSLCVLDEDVGRTDRGHEGGRKKVCVDVAAPEHGRHGS